MAEFLRYEPVKKTRKNHVCFACRDIIETGSTAYIWVSVDAGLVTSVYLHDKCGQIVQDKCFGCKQCDNWDGFDEGFIRESKSSGYECDAVKEIYAS